MTDATAHPTFLGHLVQRRGYKGYVVPPGQPIPLLKGRGTVTPIYDGPQTVALGATQGAAAVENAGREAIWKVVHEAWQLLDEAETNGEGITKPDQARWQALSDSMEALEALIPDSAGPFWGGYPVNYFWPQHPAPAESADKAVADATGGALKGISQ